MGNPASDQGIATLETLAGSATTSDEESHASEVGRVLANRYVLRALLGSGGMGMVFEAEDRRLAKRVAVKLLTNEVASKPQALERFKQEAIAAAQIGHHAIVDVTDFDQDVDGTHFMVMELIDGIALYKPISEGPMSLTRALAIASRVAEPLAHAHGRGIIHRDLKPANIMLTSIGGVADLVKVLDFGISKVLSRSDDVSVTVTGHVVGTPRYMAPEQGLPDGIIDGRTDIYALGGILYEMVTGGPVFASSSHYELMHLKLSGPPRPPSLIIEDLPLAFDRLVMRALAREPEDRFASMSEFAVAIQDLLEELAPDIAALVRPSTSARCAMAPMAPTVRKAASGKPSSSSRDELSTVSLRVGLDSADVLHSPPSSETLNIAANKSTLRVISIAGVLLALALAAVIVTGNLRRDEASSKATPVATPIQDEAIAVEVIPTEEPPPLEPVMVDLQLIIVPTGAQVELDGVITTSNPLHVPQSEQTHIVSVHATGYQSQSIEVTGTDSQQLTIELEADRPEKHPGKKNQKNQKNRPWTGPRLPDTPL